MGNYENVTRTAFFSYGIYPVSLHFLVTQMTATSSLHHVRSSTRLKSNNCRKASFPVSTPSFFATCKKKKKLGVETGNEASKRK